ncbi:hypothetical protein A0J61_07007 [Choanephora cucurbitarum]|uniref:Uncharacterized protein n=1 Tax=Choanephora cucurbitarum TaxID=101091 RepID=A0A1C7N735_9FUNG|nr:hypothetical protein A0J61_07007 [Choanephora cucurbitarum]
MIYFKSIQTPTPVSTTTNILQQKTTMISLKMSQQISFVNNKQLTKAICIAATDASDQLKRFYKRKAT